MANPNMIVQKYSQKIWECLRYESYSKRQAYLSLTFSDIVEAINDDINEFINFCQRCSVDIEKDACNLLPIIAKKKSPNLISYFLSNYQFTPDQYRNLVPYICKNKDIDALQTIISISPEIDLNICMLWTCSESFVEGLNYLIDLGADINFDDSIAMYIFCNRCADITIGKILIDHGIDYQIHNNIFINYSCQANFYNGIKLFLDSGVDVHAIRRDIVVDLIVEKSKRILKLMSQYGYDFTVLNNTPIVFNDHIQFLIDQGIRHDVLLDILTIKC